MSRKDGPNKRFSASGVRYTNTTQRCPVWERRLTQPDHGNRHYLHDIDVRCTRPRGHDPVIHPHIWRGVPFHERDIINGRA